jgi:dTDP-4-dehydrorhamnose reductase
MKRLLVTGAGGMTGSEVAVQASPMGWKVRPMAREELDISDAAAVDAAVQEFHPHAVVNCAAYTAVDRAESEPELANAINAEGARNVARAAARVEAPVIHISTDYVFDGNSREPYRPDAPTAPASVYGRTKLAGEAAVAQENEAAVIVRTSWVFSHQGSNFVRTMLRLGAERDEVRVVNDQSGRPTYAADLAMALLLVADEVVENREVAGIYHFANEGETTWFEFAKAIFEEAAAQGGLKVPRVTPISTSEFPTAAKRPAYSVLDTDSFTHQFKLTPRSWLSALRDSIALTLRDSLTVPQ